MHDGAVRNPGLGELAHGPPIQQDKIPRHGEPPQRPLDGEGRRARNVEPLYFSYARGTEGPRQRLASYKRGKPHTLRRGQLLGVRDAAYGACIGWHNDGTCDNGAR